MRSEGVSPHTNAIRTAIAEILGMENVMIRRICAKILAAAVVLFVSASPVMAVVEFNDGGVWDIDYDNNDEVWVDHQSPGMGTTINMLDGGSITPGLRSFEDSIINILGGLIRDYLYTYQSSEVTVSGGSMNRLHASSQVVVSGGTIKYDLNAYPGSQVTISGGSVEGKLNANLNSQVAVSGGSIKTGVFAFDNSQVAISGGVMGVLYTFDDSQVAVSGGSMGSLATEGSSQITVSGGSMDYLAVNINSRVIVSGGKVGDLGVHHSSQVIVSGGLLEGDMYLSTNGVLTIDGSDFAIDGTPVGYIELTSILGLGYDDEPYRRLTGTLLNGDPLDNDFRIGNSAKIILVPEPATLLLLGLGGLILRRKRRTV